MPHTAVVVESKRRGNSKRRRLHGDAGALQSLRLAARFLQNDLGLFGGDYDAGLERFTYDVLAAYGLTPASSERARAAAIHDYVSNVPYFPDPATVERVIDPRDSLASNVGIDCLNRVNLASILYAFAGLRSIWCVLRLHNPAAPPSGYDHTHVFVVVDGDWVASDVTPEAHTLKPRPFGWQLTSGVEAEAFFDPFGGAADVLTLQGIGSFFKKILPAAVGFIPVVGQFAAPALEMGIGAADAKKAAKAAKAGQANAEGKAVNDAASALSEKLHAIEDSIMAGTTPASAGIAEFSASVDTYGQLVGQITTADAKARGEDVLRQAKEHLAKVKTETAGLLKKESSALTLFKGGDGGGSVGGFNVSPVMLAAGAGGFLLLLLILSGGIGGRN